jgi:DNA recombination protein RmuC
MLAAETDDDRIRARKAFGARLRKHVDDIAGKYILPDEGTYDFALMYIPAENVYYETIIRDEDRGFASYALERKVVPVSPNSFYASLQAIVMGLKGLRIEARAAEVMGQLARVGGDLGRLRDDMRLVGKHLGNAATAQASADRRLERLQGKLGTMTEIGDEREDAAPQLALIRSQ